MLMPNCDAMKTVGIFPSIYVCSNYFIKNMRTSKCDWGYYRKQYFVSRISRTKEQKKNGLEIWTKNMQNESKPLSYDKHIKNDFDV